MGTRIRKTATERVVGLVTLPALVLTLGTLGAFVVGRIVVTASAPPPTLPAATETAPACAVATLAALEEIRLQPKRYFTFRGATIGLHGGQAECTLSREGGVIGRREVAYCEFSRPGSLEVRTEKGAYVFAPGPREPATVWFVDGAARCVSDSRLNVERHMKARREGGEGALFRTLDPP
jgi:hypothetical protein